jgi:hypothetical protein
VAAGCFRIPDWRARHALEPIVRSLPEYSGDPVRVRFRPELRAWRGQLLSKSPSGSPVHAGSEIRRREMVLDSELLKDPSELARIFVHEVHHFVWVRLGNLRRRFYEGVIAIEMRERARGELGWSAQVLKNELTPDDPVRRTRKWRDYACESFCDTAAWMYATATEHEEWTLAPGRRQNRARALRNLLSDLPVPI